VFGKAKLGLEKDQVKGMRSLRVFKGYQQNGIPVNDLIQTSQGFKALEPVVFIET